MKEYRTEECYVNYNGMNLFTRFRMPDVESGQQVPLVIMIHGLTGCMDEAQLDAVCDDAIELGMASLQMDMYGHGKSGGDFHDHTVTKWVEEINYIVDEAAADERFSDIYLAGHSQGGLAVLLAGAKKLDLVKAMVLLSPAECIVTDSIKGRFFDTVFDKDNIPDNLTFWECFTLGSEYLRDAMNTDYMAAVKAFTKPVLIVHGTDDEAVPFPDSEKLVEEYENATLVPIKGDLHCFDYHLDMMKKSVYDFLDVMNQSVSVQVMRKSDAWTIANLVPSRELMYKAGKGIFEAGKWAGPVAIVCGKGNNAGDGFVVAELMKKADIDCEIILLSDDFSEDGKYYYDIAVENGVKSRRYDSDIDFSQYGSVLDCIFGTGFKGEAKGVMREAINNINSSGTYVVSADINSGLNGDTGRGITYVKSDLTVSIGTFKYGHFLGMAAEAMKDKVNVDIGIVIQPCGK